MDEDELLDLLKAKVGEATGEKITVLYASETGNTADVAKMLACVPFHSSPRAHIVPSCPPCAHPSPQPPLSAASCIPQV